MANSSEKKSQQLYQWYIKTYLSILLGLYVCFPGSFSTVSQLFPTFPLLSSPSSFSSPSQTFYFVVRVMWSWETWTKGHIFGFFILTLINVVGIKFLFSYLSLGHPRSSYGLLEEVLWVNWFIMFLSIFTGYAFLLFLTIPGYLIYAYGPMVSNFFQSRNQQQAQYQQMMQEQQPQQQQQQQVKYKYR